MTPDRSASFSNLLNLLGDELGGQAIACSDDFFASMDNLTRPGRGEFIVDKYTDRGKWMDGWESRRKRTPGHDWCILRLGVPGSVKALDIDTNHFLGNAPSFASVEAIWAPAATTQQLFAAEWREILPQSPLRPGSQNLFVPESIGPVTHLRLHIYPDGGVARFRAHGIPKPQWTHTPDDERYVAHLQENEVDLVALRNGGQTLACSDMFFGSMHNMIAPGRAKVMGEGWETKRSRRPGFDWIIVKLGAVGKPTMAIVDTNHFKGNFPESCEIEAIHAPDTLITDLTSPDTAWNTLLPRTVLQAHHEHIFRSLQLLESATHIRLRIYPDGGISRLRLYGLRQE